LFGGNDFQARPDAFGDDLRRLDLLRAEIDDAEHHDLVF
jgi:hypothetical protein